MRRLVSRTVAVIAGLTLVLVPTLFAVFPEWARWANFVRVLVILIWLCAAAIVVLTGAQQSERVEDLLRPGRRRRDLARSAAGQRILRALLVPEAVGFPADCEFRLFLPDPSGKRLLPDYESTGSTPSEGWEVGQGATGMAFSSGSMIRVRGAAVWDATYGLTSEQQERYRNLRAVVATPVLNARVVPIGVLAVSTSSEDPFILGDTAAETLRELAEVVARVLIDIFRASRD
jgi:hypothetical protein